MERLKKTGEVPAVNSSEIRESRIGIGFEKLDRAVFDPEKAYDKVAAIGVKWVRIQSGWARTEKTPGVYEFDWLDDVIDNLLKRGLLPWICLCYGNGIYGEDAGKVFGAVGVPPIKNDTQKKAWADYVKAVAARYRGKVRHYEVWNEPDGIWCWKHGVNMTEYGNFIIDTAKAVRESDPDAYIIGGALCWPSIANLSEMLATGAAEHMNGFSFHEYTPDEAHLFEKTAYIRAVCARYNPAIEVIQGESGSQSRSDGAGALRGGSWTQLKQAKQLARHTMTDLFTDVKFTSYFSCMDMIEALNGSVGDKASYLDYGYFGVLAADFDENGFSTGEYTPKLSYRALQVFASVFREQYELTELPVLFHPCHSDRVFGNDIGRRDVISGSFRKPGGSTAFAYWKPANLMTDTFDGTVTMEILAEGTPRLVDMLDGSVYEIPENMIENLKGGSRIFRNLPVRDYPLLLTFGDFVVF